MSESIARRWQTLRTEGRAALIPYVTAGYPSMSDGVATLHMLAEAGADFIELGIPFSDPLADGPVIQASSEQALANGMTVARALALVREAALDIPVVVFGYMNPILAYGVPKFLEDAAASGVGGLLITDLPAGEDPAFEDAVRESALDLVRLVAPTTEPSRLQATLAGAEGFIYLISRLGVTGPETTLDQSVRDAVAALRRGTTLPIALGFGIGTALQAREAARIADGVVVGTALIRALAQGPDAAQSLMRELRDAVKSVERSLDGAGAGSAQA